MLYGLYHSTLCCMCIYIYICVVRSRRSWHRRCRRRLRRPCPLSRDLRLRLGVEACRKALSSAALCAQRCAQRCAELHCAALRTPRRAPHPAMCSALCAALRNLCLRSALCALRCARRLRRVASRSAPSLLRLQALVSWICKSQIDLYRDNDYSSVVA